MSLTAFIKGKFNPTPAQEKALAALDRFFQSNRKVFLLKGYAGTGKTTLTRYIADYFRQEKINTVLIAPTGRAARILELKTGHPATTIHKAIYNLHVLDEEKTRENGREKYKFRYRLRHVESNVTNIYLVDEASMIADVRAEDDFFIFGSGHLLSDLLQFIAPENFSRKDKIIFIGDPAQLPPVQEPVSKALSREHLLAGFGLEADEYELNDVVRQGRESGILKIAGYLRQQINNKKRNSFQLSTPGPDTVPINPENVVDVFLKENPGLEIDRSVIIHFSNKSAFDYNLKVREKVFTNVLQVAPDDTLIVNQNNYNYAVEILNGMMVKVVEVGPLEIKSNMLAYDESGEECRVTHKFRRVKIRVPNQNDWIDISCLILENFLYNPNPSLIYPENIALYLDFKIRHAHLKPKTKEFADALRSDPYFNALKVKYGYAITCHKAQGGEWESVIVNMDVSQSVLSNAFLRWAYTAVTRAGKQLYLFNIPAMSVFSAIDYRHQLLPAAGTNSELPKQIIFSLPPNLQELREKLQLHQEKTFLQDKHIEMLARISGTDIEIISREGRPYQEHYGFKKENQNARLTFHYNGKNNFTSIVISNSPQYCSQFSMELKAMFSAPVTILMADKEAGIEPAKGQEPSVSFAGCGELEPLYRKLSPLLQDRKISIGKVEHKLYHELYFVSRQNEKACLCFYYSDKNQFTTAWPLLNECNSNPLLSDINEAIQELKKICL